MKKLGFLIVLVAFAFSFAPGWALDTVRISHSAVSGSQAVLFVTRDAGFFKTFWPRDPKRFVEPRFLKELEDNGTVAQLYR
jgi:hypothetical protein